MTTRPDVTRLVLFKHGIAYLERRGAAESTFDLSFRSSEMNDVLKSLAVGVADGSATVTSLGYAAPTDPDDDLARRDLLLPQGDALIGLLRVARGRTVEATTGGGSTSGEVIGVQEDGDRRQLVLWTSGRVELVDLASVTGVRFADQQTDDDIAYLVDRSRAATAGETRTVTVALSGPADDVHVSYIVQAPVWRVSYRLVCDGDDVDLIAVGIVHNPVDEDLDDIDLTLTTGRPSSFEIDLYRDRRVQRATVDDVDYETGPPTEYETLRTFGIDAAMPAGAPPRAAPSARRGPVSSFGDDVAETADVGEQFEYRVHGKVSLKRGMASMVPLVTARLAEARRERIWRVGSSSEPDIVAAFDNSTGAVLETGPVVVYDDGSYAGEAMMPFTARGAGARLTFGKDPSISCSHDAAVNRVVTRVRIGGDALIEEVRLERVHHLSITNTGDVDRDVIIETRFSASTTVITRDDFIEPFETTPSYRRYRLTVPAHSRVVARAGESELISMNHSYTDLTYLTLADWLDKRVLDREAFAGLTAVLAHHRKAEELDARVTQLDTDRDRSIAEQDRLTQHLEVLHTDGAEGKVRSTTVAKLVAQQERIEDIDEQIAAAVDGAAAERALADAALAALTSAADTED